MGNSFQIIIPAIVGILFVASYFLADKNSFFGFLAYFPRKREGSMKVGGLAFGCGFLIVALINYIRLS